MLCNGFDTANVCLRVFDGDGQVGDVFLGDGFLTEDPLREPPSSVLLPSCNLCIEADAEIGGVG